MKGLLIKDFKLMKQQKNFFLMILAIALFFAAAYEMPSFIISYVTVFFGIFALNTISYDTYESGEAFLFTLPVSRKGYVQEKYLFSFLLVAIAVSASSLLTWISMTLRNLPLVSEEFWGTIVATLMLLVFLNAVMLPVYLKFSVDKGKLVQLIFFGIIFLGIFGGIKLCDIFEVDINRMIDHLVRQSLQTLLLGIAAVSTVMLAVSYVISVKIMEKKEF